MATASEDVPAGLVVFLVALPLCLGIAQASGAPLLAGLLAGVVGGVIISLASGSPLSVSGPAAGLAVIVAAGIQELGFSAFLLAVVVAGAFQLTLGLLRLGRIAHFFPASVIKGMLAAIGVLIVLKQLPHAVGYDRDYEGDNAFLEADGSNTFSALLDASGALHPGATLISVLCIGVLLGWPRLQKIQFLRYVPPALMVVVVGGVLSVGLGSWWPSQTLSDEHLVALPSFSGPGDVLSALVLPDFARIADPAVWRVGLTIGIVASIETLLSLEAIDRLDPHRRISPPNRELLAQGLGNLVSGLVGGLPVTSVIVRSSANVVAGGQSKLSSLVHGVLLLIGLLFLAPVLNHVPLAALAVVLIAVGIKLTAPKLWQLMWRAGPSQFIPFAVTVAAVVFTDLLKGTLIGLVVGVIVTLRNQQRNSLLVARDENRFLIRATKDLTFLQKGQVKEALSEVPAGGSVIIDRSRADYVDPDIEELFQDFKARCEELDIHLEWKLKIQGGPALPTPVTIAQKESAA